MAILLVSMVTVVRLSSTATAASTSAHEVGVIWVEVVALGDPLLIYIVESLTATSANASVPTGV